MTYHHMKTHGISVRFIYYHTSNFMVFLMQQYNTMHCVYTYSFKHLLKFSLFLMGSSFVFTFSYELIFISIWFISDCSYKFRNLKGSIVDWLINDHQFARDTLTVKCKCSIPPEFRLSEFQHSELWFGLGLKLGLATFPLKMSKRSECRIPGCQNSEW